MFGSTLDPSLPVSFPDLPSRSKAYILCYLPLVDLGNPYQAFLIPSMEKIEFLWSSTDSLRWLLWWPARRISQHKSLLKSSLDEYGFTLGSHSLSYHIGIACFSAHFGLASGQLWTPSSPSP